MNPFERHNISHLSASQINCWLAAPSLWVLEKLLKHRGGMGCAAHRGTATEAGVSAGLFDPTLSVEDCVAVALPVYDKLTALNGDSKREAERALIPGMVAQGLALRSHGAPIRPNNGDQHRIEIRLEGVSVPIVGFLDWEFADEVIDLKSTSRVPSAMSEPHLRQASIYKTSRMGKRVRFAYVSDKKIEKHTLTREQYDASIRQIVGAAQRLERFLGLSNDAAELAALIPHSTDTFFWSDPATRAKGAEVFGY